MRNNGKSSLFFSSIDDTCVFVDFCLVREANKKQRNAKISILNRGVRVWILLSMLKYLNEEKKIKYEEKKINYEEKKTIE